VVYENCKEIVVSFIEELEACKSCLHLNFYNSYLKVCIYEVLQFIYDSLVYVRTFLFDQILYCAKLGPALMIKEPRCLCSVYIVANTALQCA
jgi:hypothetical protein